MKYRSLFVLLIFIVFSCNKGIAPKNECQLQKTDSTISIKIASNISCTSRNIRYFHDNGMEYLAVQNDYKGLSIYRLDSCTLVKDIFPQIEGPDGIDSPMAGFDIVNLDSIILLTDGICDKIVLIDSGAHVVKKIKFDISYRPYFPLTTLWSCYGEYVNFTENQIIIGSVCMDTDESFLENHNQYIAYCYDLKTDSQSVYPVKFPNIQNEKPPIQYSEAYPIINKNKVVLSYSLGHQIFVSTNNEEWEKMLLKSRYINKPLQSSTGTDMYESLKKYAESPYYLAFVYDKYRHVYYRFVYPGIDVGKNDDVMKLGEFRRIFSVMVIDEDFNILGETLMPENTYNSNMFFINEAGLWISTNHPDNPEFDEDMIKFQLFTLK